MAHYASLNFVMFVNKDKGYTGSSILNHVSASRCYDIARLLTEKSCFSEGNLPIKTLDASANSSTFCFCSYSDSYRKCRGSVEDEFKFWTSVLPSDVSYFVYWVSHEGDGMWCAFSRITDEHEGFFSAWKEKFYAEETGLEDDDDFYVDKDQSSIKLLDFVDVLSESFT